MAECHEDIVYRTVGSEHKVSAAVADDDSALVKAYEKALKTFQGPDSENEGLLESVRPKKDSSGMITMQWTVGSRCQAVWSGDGLVYPAVLVWVNGERGRVQFDGYGNEEELELRALLHPDAQLESVNAAREFLKRDPDGGSSSECRTNTQKASAATWGVSTTTSSCCPTDAGGDKDVCCNKTEKRQKNRRISGTQKEGPQTHIQGFLPLPPPPPPLYVWPTKGNMDKEGNGTDVDVAHLSSMLLSWYLCGYHTGYYMATQHAKASKEKTEEKPKSPWKHKKCAH